ncbi:MAG: exodeoxyribonuclease VII small subunit [Candidatus Marinimicrobia bacterium]|nr:exodeoxyribonuclease VII small subunit [Candidatus Neomarinimicrobiota bacterium]
MAEEKFSLEKSIEKLKEILEKLESGDENIEDSIKLYEEGMELSKKCRKHLEALEERVKILSEDDKNGYKEENFD